jgi:hypothetical protein
MKSEADTMRYIQLCTTIQSQESSMST